jgi:TonB family protein
LRNIRRVIITSSKGKGVDPKLLALKLTLRDNRPGQPLAVLTREVVSLSSDSLPDSLFEVPEGFTEKPAEPASLPVRNCDTTAGANNGKPAALNFSLEPDGTKLHRPGPGIIVPKPIYHPEPQYTDAARKAKVSGTLVLSITVTAEGSVRDLRVERSLRGDLDEQALNTVSTWRFQPGTKDGRPVPVRLNIEVSFNVR